MDDIFVGQLMSSGCISASPDTSVQEAARTLLDRNIGSLVIVDDDNHIQGIVTSTDFVRIVRDNEPGDESTVGDHMTEQVVTVTAQDPIQSAADKLITYDIHHLPVVDDEEGVIGMLSTTDLTAYISAVRKPSPA